MSGLKEFNAFERAEIMRPAFDEDLKHMISSWDDPPTALQVFRVVDEIKLMRAYDTIAPFALIERLDKLLEQAMMRENVNIKELGNRALWRDQDF